MKVTVFGGSGKVGQLVVAEALARGHSVTAYVHKHNPYVAAPAVSFVQGDISDDALVREALQGSEAVLCTLGSWGSKSKDIVSRGIEAILPAMAESGITRIITVTGTAAVWSGDGKTTVLGRWSRNFLKLVAPKILQDGEKHLALLDASSVDWTCVRSPAMAKGAKRDYHLTNKLAPPWAKVNRAAVAACMVDRLEAGDYNRAAPVIYRGKA